MGEFKININIAFLENLSIGAMVIRYHKGLLLQLSFVTMEALSLIVAEAKALVWAMKLAANCGWS